jgi:hypothetical protein
MAKPLSEMSEADFRALAAEVSAESSRRIKVEHEARIKRHEDHVAALKAFLRTHPEAIDIFCPKHDGKNCNDDNASNGLEEDYPCTRCALIDLKRESSWPELPENKWVRLVLADSE